jgi:serine/threonine protein kinase
MDQPGSPSAVEIEQRLERAIAEYLEAAANGEPPDPAEMLAAYPELADELNQFFADHNQVMRLADSWRSEVAAQEIDERFASSSGSQRRTPATADTQILSEGAASSPAVATQSASAPVRLGDYELLQEIARGGMGVVYKARQVSLNRIVAIKMILQGQLAAAEEVDRFTLEAEAAAKLAHPHIVVIHDVGRLNDQHYFSMEYVEGENLAQVIRRGSVSFQQAATYLEQIAKAVDYAHRNGVLHRDIKPSNVLLDPTGRVRVTDFGLAKHFDRGEELTVTGQIIGTPAYMAPEQITGRRGEIGPPCDVYALGAILYELLTGQPLFKGRDYFETLLHVLECQPQSPRELNPDVPRELEMICLKCLEKEPQHRYQSAGGVSEDLQRFLNGDSISLTSPKLADRLVRTLERSHYDREFHTWARILFHLAWIALATHVLVFLNRTIPAANPLGGLIAIRGLEIAGMAIVLSTLRRQWYPVRGAPARQLLSLWFGYMAGSLVLLVITYLLTPSGAVFNDYLAYPPMAVLASLLFMMLGSSYWGYCYVIGLIFLAVAIVMTVWLAAAPLIFGAAWAASLSTLGVRLGRLAGNR